MKYFVYILKSLPSGKYYKGFSTDPKRRLIQHNNKESKYTSNFTPWKLIHLESFDTKTDALRREKVLKKYSKAQVESLIQTPKNELD